MGFLLFLVFVVLLLFLLVPEGAPGRLRFDDRSIIGVRLQLS